MGDGHDSRGAARSRAARRAPRDATDGSAVSAGVLLAALLGGVLGLASDRLAARWPAHEDGRVRGVDWRTPVVTLSGAVAFGALVARWPEPFDQAVLGLALAALLVLLATDLDQRLLPDVVTLPLAAYTLALALLDLSPTLAGTRLSVPVALVTGLAAPAVLLVTDRLFRGGLGMGDVKLAVSLGLLLGASRLLLGFLAASIVASVILVALMALGRIGRRTYIPFGPILIGAGVVGMLLA
jgi:leader peptidase (prepilin peptidase) / N-methyltransferase